MSIVSNIRNGQVAWKCWAWRITTLPVIWLLYSFVCAEGIRSQIAVFGTPLWKMPVPFFSLMRSYEGLHRLDLAFVLASCIMVAVFVLTARLLKIILSADGPHPFAGLDVEKWIVVVLSITLLLGDASIFFVGLFERTDSLWGGEQRVLVPAIATVMYIAIVTFIAYIDARLELSFLQSVETQNATAQ